jgi:hypothetical protein
MKGQEVMELMNRYLDGDLDELELERLERHLQQSPEAAAMFERLKRLHHQLEQLPMVTPPTSIVDAILPKLERIDAGEEGPAETRNVADIRPERLRRQNRIWAAGSVAAAVLVLAVALPTGILVNRNGMDSAESLSGAAPQTEAGRAMRFEANSAAFGQSSAFSIADETALSADAGAPGDGTPLAGLPSEKAKEDMQVQFTVKDQHGPGFTGMTSFAGEPDPAESSGEEQMAGMIEEGVPLLGEGEQLMGILGFAEDPSADERIPVTAYAEGVPPAGWQASVAKTGDGAFVIVTDEAGVDVFVTAVYPGEPVNFGWSEDGNRLAFEYEQDGEVRRVTIDLAAGTERSEAVLP